MVIIKIVYKTTLTNSYYEKMADGTVRCIDSEIPFDIPKSWEWVRLGHVIDFSKSKSIKNDSISADSWLLDLEDIEKDTGIILRKKLMKDVSAKSDKHAFKEGKKMKAENKRNHWRNKRYYISIV